MTTPPPESATVELGDTVARTVAVPVGGLSMYQRLTQSKLPPFCPVVVVVSPILTIGVPP